MTEHLDRFNAAAREYKTDRYPGRAQCARKVLEFLEPHNDDVVLDVGCGPGIQLITLAPLIKHGYGIDPAEQMIQRARQAATDFANLSFYIGSVECLSPDIAHLGINKILTNYVLHHLSDGAKRNVICDLAAVLPSNGMLILGDLMFSDDPDKYEALFDFVGFGPGSDTPSELSLLENMFIAAGMSPVSHLLNPLVGVIIGKKT
jgi:ubiquinone/menaquinone biosynthesis C-methylase UbiE